MPIILKSQLSTVVVCPLCGQKIDVKYGEHEGITVLNSTAYARFPGKHQCKEDSSMDLWVEVMRDTA